MWPSRDNPAWSVNLHTLRNSESPVATNEQRTCSTLFCSLETINNSMITDISTTCKGTVWLGDGYHCPSYERSGVDSQLQKGESLATVSPVLMSVILAVTQIILLQDNSAFWGELTQQWETDSSLVTWQSRRVDKWYPKYRNTRRQTLLLIIGTDYQSDQIICYQH
mgnify:CR=1 FL=1